MPAGVKLHSDWNAELVDAAASICKDIKQFHRLRAIAAVYRGASRAAAAKIGGMDRQTLRDWVHRFNMGGPDSLMDRKAPPYPLGKPPKLTLAQKAELVEIVERGPDIAPVIVGDGIVRWRCRDLVGVIDQRFEVQVSEATVGRMLKENGFTHVSARSPTSSCASGTGCESYRSFKKTSASA